MPIYEYKCNKCGRAFDMVQKITDPEVKNCSSCNGPVKKLISLSAFHLKGSGWYATDYSGKKTSTKNKSKDESKAPSLPSKASKNEPVSKSDDKT